MASQRTIQISKSSGKGLDALLSLKDLPWKNISYEGSPNFLVIDGVTNAGKDSVMNGLLYMLAYSAALDKPRLHERVNKIGYTVALEDRLNSLISADELQKFKKYDLPGHDIIESALAYSDLANKDDAQKSAVKDALFRIREERTKLYNSMKDELPFVKILSYVTRRRRTKKGELQDDIYHFTNRPYFEKMIDEGRMLEYALVHGRLYGTPKFETDGARFGVKQIEPQGCEMLIKTYYENSGIKPYFMIIDVPEENVRQRIKKRGDSESEIERRLASMRIERPLFGKILEHAPGHIIENSGHIYQARMEAYNTLVNLGMAHPISDYPTAL